MARKAFHMGRSGTQYVAMVTELLSSYFGSHLLESKQSKESNISGTNWPRLEGNLVECMTSTLG